MSNLNIILLISVLFIQSLAFVWLADRINNYHPRAEWKEKVLDSERANIKQFEWLEELEKRVDKFSSLTRSRKNRLILITS